MKNVNVEIDPSKVVQEPEKSTKIEIAVSEFNPETAYLELPEDLDEKTIGYIEREVRNSYEYRQYLSYLKSELDLTKCSMLPGIDCSDGAATLEFHHFPMNLYEITEAVGQEMINELGDDEYISCFDVAERVMEEHYRGNIGLVPLTKTLHEMAHNKAIIIPASKINGNYKKFMKKYSEFISSDIKDRVKDIELTSETDDAKEFNKAKLEKNILKYDIKYQRKDDDEGGDDGESEVSKVNV